MNSSLPSIDDSQLQQLAEAGHQIQATKCFFLAGLVVLFYDHLLTFQSERKHIWKRKKTFITWIFFVNRYYTPATYVIASFMFFSPLITPGICKHLALFLPLGIGLPVLMIPSLLLTVRIYALYGRNKWIAGTFLCYLIAQLGIGLWIYTFPGQGPLALPPIALDSFEICIDAISPRLGTTAVSYVMMDCVFDITIIALILNRSLRAVLREKASRSQLLHTILRDGLLYFVFIFSNKSAWSIMILAAPLGLKWTCALPAIAFVATMANRITMNLRADAFDAVDVPTTISFEAPALTSRKKNIYQTSITYGNDLELNNIV